MASNHLPLICTHAHKHAQTTNVTFMILWSILVFQGTKAPPIRCMGHHVNNFYIVQWRYWDEAIVNLSYLPTTGKVSASEMAHCSITWTETLQRCPGRRPLHESVFWLTLVLSGQLPQFMVEMLYSKGVQLFVSGSQLNTTVASSRDWLKSALRLVGFWGPIGQKNDPRLESYLHDHLALIFVTSIIGLSICTQNKRAKIDTVLRECLWSRTPMSKPGTTI